MTLTIMILLGIVLLAFLPLAISVLKAMVQWHGETESSNDRLVQ